MFTFGNDRSNFSDVVNRGELTLRHLLLKDWDANWETLPFPPAQGDFAVYDIEELKERINFAVQRVRVLIKCFACKRVDYFFNLHVAYLSSFKIGSSFVCLFFLFFFLFFFVRFYFSHKSHTGKHLLSFFLWKYSLYFPWSLRILTTLSFIAKE